MSDHIVLNQKCSYSTIENVDQTEKRLFAGQDACVQPERYAVRVALYASAEKVQLMAWHLQ